jgi:hypothetical protein
MLTHFYTQENFQHLFRTYLGIAVVWSAAIAAVSVISSDALSVSKILLNLTRKVAGKSLSSRGCSQKSLTSF